MNDADQQKLITVVNQQKGELIFLNALCLSVLHTMPAGSLELALRALEVEVDAASGELPGQPEEVAQSLGRCHRNLQSLMKSWTGNTPGGLRLGPSGAAQIGPGQ